MEKFRSLPPTSDAPFFSSPLTHPPFPSVPWPLLLRRRRCHRPLSLSPVPAAAAAAAASPLRPPLRHRRSENCPVEAPPAASTHRGALEAPADPPPPQVS